MLCSSIQRYMYKDVPCSAATVNNWTQVNYPTVRKHYYREIIVHWAYGILCSRLNGHSRFLFTVTQGVLRILGDKKKAAEQFVLHVPICIIYNCKCTHTFKQFEQIFHVLNSSHLWGGRKISYFTLNTFYNIIHYYIIHLDQEINQNDFIWVVEFRWVILWSLLFIFNIFYNTIIILLYGNKCLLDITYVRCL